MRLYKKLANIVPLHRQKWRPVLARKFWILLTDFFFDTFSVFEFSQCGTDAHPLVEICRILQLQDKKSDVRNITVLVFEHFVPYNVRGRNNSLENGKSRNLNKSQSSLESFWRMRISHLIYLYISRTENWWPDRDPHCLDSDVWYIYRPHPKDREGTVFTGVRLFTPRRGVP